jgi:hypothetical protein
MIGHGQALEMKLRLRRLMQEHGSLPQPYIVPLSPPTAVSQILEGFAATSHIDADRTRFAPFAFGLLRKRRPLLFKHDPSQVAGEVEELRYTDRGALYIRARVDRPEATRCGAFTFEVEIIADRQYASPREKGESSEGAPRGKQPHGGQSQNDGW